MSMGGACRWLAGATPDLRGWSQATQEVARRPPATAPNPHFSFYSKTYGAQFSIYFFFFEIRKEKKNCPKKKKKKKLSLLSRQS
jgi:hypothetical protein